MLFLPRPLWVLLWSSPWVSVPRLGTTLVHLCQLPQQPGVHPVPAARASCCPVHIEASGRSLLTLHAQSPGQCFPMALVKHKH